MRGGYRYKGSYTKKSSYTKKRHKYAGKKYKKSQRVKYN